MCQFTVFLKAVRSFVSDVFSYFAEYSGFPDGSRGTSIPESSICKFVDSLIVRIILQTLGREVRCVFDFLFVWN